MPVGIITDAAATFTGAVIGCLLGTKLSERWKSMLNNVISIAAIVMGIVLILRVHTLSAAVLALIVGAIVGEVIDVEKHIGKAASFITGKLMRGDTADETFLMKVSAALVLFCCGGTGWYGALNEGLTGDGSILITKAILDCVTACIFAALLGKIVLCLSVPQLAVYLTLFFVSGVVSPYITPEMIADFSAVGGIVTLVAGLRLAKIKADIKVLNLLPGLVLAFFVSAAWTAFVS